MSMVNFSKITVNIQIFTTSNSSQYFVHKTEQLKESNLLKLEVDYLF